MSMALSESVISSLTSKGFKRWTKGNCDRLYINARDLGLVCTYYKTGNIHSAEFNGERISNSMGYRYKAAKTFVDVSNGKVYSDFRELAEAAEKLVISESEV